MLRPKKRWGQNFLNDLNISKKIIDLLDNKSNDEVLEIGPGEGALTKLITGKNITAIEIDPNLCETLSIIKNPNLKIINENFLKFNLNTITFNKVVGNLPYNISSQIIFKIIQNQSWEKAIFMIQKELADRITSKEGSREYGRISVMIQSVCKVKKEFNVSHNCFYPKPDVQSTVISLEKKEIIDFDFEKLEKIVRKSFSQRRKKLKNTLKEIIEYQELKNYHSKRAEMLTIEDFLFLSNTIKNLD